MVRSVWSSAQCIANYSPAPRHDSSEYTTKCSVNYEGFQSGWWRYSLFPALGELKLLYSNPFRWFISKPQVVFHMLGLISTLTNTWGIPLQSSRILFLCSFVIPILYLMKSSHLVVPGLLDLPCQLRKSVYSTWVSPPHSVTWKFLQISELRQF